MKSNRKKSISAGELVKQLSEDPNYQRLISEQEQRRLAAVHENARAAAPIKAELKERGFELETMAGLRQNYRNYRAAIPILLKWLPLVDNLSIKEDIVRDLSVPWAGPEAAPALITEFEKSEDGHDVYSIRWTIGNALSVVADDSVYNAIVKLARDRQYGRSREMLALALARMRNPAAIEVLIELLNDPQMAGHAVMALRKLGRRASNAREHLVKFLDHDRAWVRQEAKRALQKIDARAG